MCDIKSHTTLSLHLQRTDVRATGLKSFMSLDRAFLVNGDDYRFLPQVGRTAAVQKMLEQSGDDWPPSS